jgi:hypothetical protein
MTTTKSNGHPSLAGLIIYALRMAEWDLEGRGPFGSAHIDNQLWHVHNEMRERSAPRGPCGVCAL